MDKIQFMKELSSSFSIYEAARWLSKPNDEIGGKIPAELLNKNQIKTLYELLKKQKDK